MIARALLLAGWFLLPVVLLWLGQHLRAASARRRRTFWGGVIGYGLGVLASLLALHAPPVLWQDDGRMWLALGGVALGAVAGMAAGALSSRRAPGS